MEKLPTGPALLPRYTHRERLTHWAVAVAYVALFFSGLALFHPYFYWLSALFGGGPLMRVIHPFLGATFAVLFYVYALRLVRDNLLLPSDRKWLAGMFSYMNRRGDDVPVEGKYNAGQKLMYWSMVPIIAVLFLTGITMWQPWFAGSFPAPLRRVTSLLHAVAAFVMFIGIGIHWYAAYWTRGSIRAMVRGTVTKTWARYHHPAWFREITGGKDR
jgi:formate dehydrogenase subunit gamma